MSKKTLGQSEIAVLLDFLKEKVDGIFQIGITGSYANNAETLKSDLDIVVEIQNDSLGKFWEVADEVKSFFIDEYMLPIDFIFYHDIKNKLGKKITSDCDRVPLDNNPNGVFRLGKIQFLSPV